MSVKHVLSYKWVIVNYLSPNQIMALADLSVELQIKLDQIQCHWLNC